MSRVEVYETVGTVWVTETSRERGWILLFEYRCRYVLKAALCYVWLHRSRGHYTQSASGILGQLCTKLCTKNIPSKKLALGLWPGVGTSSLNYCRNFSPLDYMSNKISSFTSNSQIFIISSYCWIISLQSAVHVCAAIKKVYEKKCTVFAFSTGYSSYMKSLVLWYYTVLRTLIGTPAVSVIHIYCIPRETCRK